MGQSDRTVSRDEFDRVVEALWSEIEYQNSLPRRTEDEAQDVPGFCTLMRRYLRKVEDDWADNPGPVKAAEEGLRKLSAIALRGMVYTRIWKRGE
jgi:hypothetical protein